MSANQIDRHPSRRGSSGARLAAVALLASAVAGAAQAGGPPAAAHITLAETQAFIAKFEKAWSSREDADFVAIWHPDGQLIYPFVGRVIRGRELPILNAITKQNAPELKWRMVDWTSRGNTIVVEWESTNRYGPRTVTWRGVDKLTLVDGRIMEEVVYTDTAPFQALRRGEPLASLIPFPAPKD